MIFTGHAELNIDAKQRLSIPAKFKSMLSVERDGKAWYCVPYGEKKLVLFTEKRFDELAEGRDATLTPNRLQSKFDVSFFGLCERIEPDAAGRIVIPRLHRELAGLGDEVVMIGGGKYLELWNKQRWIDELPTMHKNLDGMMDQVNPPLSPPSSPSHLSPPS